MFRISFFITGLCLPALVSAAALPVVVETPIAHESIAPGSQRIPLISLKFDLPCDGEPVTEVIFRHAGAGALTDFSALYLLDSNGERRSVVRTFSNHSGFLTIPLRTDSLRECGVSTLVLAGDLSSDANPLGVHRLELTRASTPSGQLSIQHSATISGSAPYSPAGAMTYEFLRLTKNPRGAMMSQLHRFQLKNDSNFDQELLSMHFTLGGTVREKDVSHLELLWRGQRLASVNRASDDGVTFVLEKPFVIPSRARLQFVVQGIIEHRAYGTLSFSIRDASDIVVQTRHARAR